MCQQQTTNHIQSTNTTGLTTKALPSTPLRQAQWRQKGLKIQIWLEPRYLFLYCTSNDFLQIVYYAYGTGTQLEHLGTTITVVKHHTTAMYFTTTDTHPLIWFDYYYYYY